MLAQTLIESLKSIISGQQRALIGPAMAAITGCADVQWASAFPELSNAQNTLQLWDIQESQKSVESDADKQESKRKDAIYKSIFAGYLSGAFRATQSP
jgi:hypothetical protein